MSRHTVSTVCTYVPNMKRECWKLWELECGQEGMENSILVAMSTTLDDVCRDTPSPQSVPMYQIWKLKTLGVRVRTGRDGNSTLVAMATTLDDERMSRHTVSTVCTYAPNMKHESWELWELECGQERTDGRTDRQTDRQTDKLVGEDGPIWIITPGIAEISNCYSSLNIDRIDSIFLHNIHVY